MDRETTMARNHDHLIDITPDTSLVSGTVAGAAAGVAAGRGGGGGGDEAKQKWLRKLTSATVNSAVLRDLISRTPMLWYLGERSGTILRPRTRRARVAALHAVRAVAIGPFHRRDAGLAFPDDAKLPFLRYLQDQCGLDVDGYVAALALERGRLRDEFADDGDEDDEAVVATLDDEEKFLEMLLLDSCFLLVVSMMLSKAGAGDDDADSVMRAACISKEYFILHMAVAQHADDIKLDMLVLENQVPFAAVKLLAAFCGSLKLRHSVEELVLGCFDDICPKRARRAGDDAAGEFYHVLHLFHWSRVPKNKYNVLSTPLKLLRIKKESERLFPCYMELRRSAVWFRQAAPSAGGGDLDMWFWRHPASPVAVMSVPCLHIHDYSAAVLHNLVAFEKHFYWAHGACVTAHVARMEGLVRCPPDAAMLRRRGVLATARRTDAELVALFRELGEETVGARLPDEYGEMLDAVARHRRRRVSCWCGGFVLHFFPSPWVAVSLAAAAALIVVPSMLQTVYTVLSYFKSS
ncbi:hypothetical protein ACP70R_048526 [Stipagrostis hirtigluma subsp. patula]